MFLKTYKRFKKKTYQCTFTILLAMLLPTVCAHAQDNISNYIGTDGEIVFILGSLDENLTEDPEITMNLNGPVFGEYGDWNVAVEITHNNYGDYSSDDLYGTSMTLEEGTRDIICWESAYEGDDTANPDKCPGMVGWGEYEISIVSDENTLTFDLSTLDGEWMNVDTAANQLIFYLEFEENAITAQIYNWSSSSWESVAQDDRITYWENHSTGRNRTTIEALSEDFGIRGSSEIPLVVTETDLDINVHIKGDIEIPSGKSLHIKDYYNRHLGQYEPSYWNIDHYSYSIDSYGILTTRSVNPNILSNSSKAVYFQPTTVQRGPTIRPWESWKGIVNHFSSGIHPELDFEHTFISHAIEGIGGSGGIRLSNCTIDSCFYGIATSNQHIAIDSCKINYCWLGVYLRGYSNHMTTPSYINESELFFNIISGIVIMENWYGPGKDPEELMLVRNSEVKFSGSHGIQSEAGFCAVRNSILARNGWHGGVLTSSDSVGGDGIFGAESYINITKNEFDTNTRYGVGSSQTDYLAKAASNYLGDAADYNGENCFDNNFINVNGDNQSNLVMGDITKSSPLMFASNLNAFVNPRKTDPATQHKVNVRILGWTNMKAYNNYWYPAFTETLDLGEGFIDTGYPIIASDSVRCGVGNGTDGSGLEESKSETTERLEKNYLTKSYQAAYDTAKAYISDSLGQRDSFIYIKALEYSYVFGGIDSALTLIEDEALEAKDPNETASDLDMFAMTTLRKLYLITDDSSGFYALNDSIKARLPITDDAVNDSILVDLFEAKAALLLQDDEAVADSLITDLFGEYPYHQPVQTFYVLVTKDTTAYYVPAAKRVGTRDGERLVPERIILLYAYPNPFNPVTNIVYGIPRPMDVSLRIYDILGREVMTLVSGIVEPGMYEMQFDASDMPSGIYRCMLSTDEGVKSINLMLVK